MDHDAAYSALGAAVHSTGRAAACGRADARCHPERGASARSANASQPANGPSRPAVLVAPVGAVEGDEVRAMDMGQPVAHDVQGALVEGALRAARLHRGGLCAPARQLARTT